MKVNVGSPNITRSRRGTTTPVHTFLSRRPRPFTLDPMVRLGHRRVVGTPLELRRVRPSDGPTKRLRLPLPFRH